VSIGAHELRPDRGATHKKKRIGRGNASGQGTYAGKGLKGQKSRSGKNSPYDAFEGGQFPFWMRLPKRGVCFLSVKDADKETIVPIARRLTSIGFSLIATDGTQRVLAAAGLNVGKINKVAQGSPHIVELIEKRGVDLVINTTIGKQSIIDSFSIRERALRYGVPYFTVLATAREAVESLSVHVTDSLGVTCLQEYHRA
jgi:carbamoyl-phosphate synthase large subunit